MQITLEVDQLSKAQSNMRRYHEDRRTNVRSGSGVLWEYPKAMTPKITLPSGFPITQVRENMALRELYAQ